MLFLIFILENERVRDTSIIYTNICNYNYLYISTISDPTWHEEHSCSPAQLYRIIALTLMILCQRDRSGPFRDVRYEVWRKKDHSIFFPILFYDAYANDCLRSRLRFAKHFFFLDREEKEATRDKKGKNDVSDIIRRKLCSKHIGGEVARLLSF